MKNLIRKILSEQLSNDEILFNGIKKSLNKFITNKGFDWVDSIDIKKGSTLSSGWKYHYPINNYIINYKESETKFLRSANSKSLKELERYVMLLHNEVYPKDSEGQPIVYYKIEDNFSTPNMRLRESINEVRVPREERVELYKDNNIIVVVPLTHRALQKYAHRCQWCINDDRGEWEDYHQKKHAVIIQRKPKKNKKGITGMETEGEIYLLSKLDNDEWDWKSVVETLGYDFGGSKEKALDYFVEISNDINNFNLNIVYYSPENGIYDMEDNFLWNYNFEISDIPNVTNEVIDIMDDYLIEE